MSERILRGGEVDRMTGLSRTSRYELEKAGKFPKRRRISERASGYLASEVDEWIRSRPLADDRPAIVAPNQSAT